ncbi:MAG TPA: hypothetical protein VIZ65_01190 [Cellvibrionaceae bacterium]
MIIFHSTYNVTSHAHYNKPLLAYHSILRISDITSQNPGPRAPTNMWSPDTASLWQAQSDNEYIQLDNPAGLEFDYIAIARHNLFTEQISFLIIKDDNATGSEITIVNWQTVSDDGPIFIGLLGITSKRIRIYFQQSTSKKPIIAHIKMGKMLRLPMGVFVGEKPISLPSYVDSIVQTSESGQYLGRVNKSRWKTASISQKHNTQQFVYTELKPFIDHCAGTAFNNGTAQETFFYIPRPQKNAGTGNNIVDIIYGWTKGPIVPECQDAAGYMQWSVQIEGIV